MAPTLVHQAKPAKRVIGADLADAFCGAFDKKFDGDISLAGRPRLPVRLMVSLLHLKNSFNLNDEALVARWAKNVKWQFFGGTEQNKTIAHPPTYHPVDSRLLETARATRW